MFDFFIKIFEGLFEFFCPGKLTEWQTKASRLTFDDPVGVEEFSRLYTKLFPPSDPRNYTAEELLEAVKNPQNEGKKVVADNIILLAKYKNETVGFLACFYYPDVEYGIIGYLGRDKKKKEKGNYATIKLVEKLQSIVTTEHNCKLIIFELELLRRDESKANLFRSCADKLQLSAFELEFEYWRPKMKLDDPSEEQLRLFIIPTKRNFERFLDKNQTLNILSFLHFYCYGDYYDIDDPNNSIFEEYLKGRMKTYEEKLPDTIRVKE